MREASVPTASTSTSQVLSDALASAVAIFPATPTITERDSRVPSAFTRCNVYLTRLGRNACFARAGSQTRHVFMCKPSGPTLPPRASA